MMEKNKLKERIDYLKQVKMKEVRKKVVDARKFCDFNEDASYKDFIDEQFRLEAEIKELEQKLQEGEKAFKDHPLKDKTITCRWSDGEVVSYTLVSPLEADAEAGLISLEAPLAASLKEAKVGEKLKVKLPQGSEEVEVLEIK